MHFASYCSSEPGNTASTSTASHTLHTRFIQANTFQVPHSRRTHIGYLYTWSHGNASTTLPPSFVAEKQAVVSFFLSPPSVDSLKRTSTCFCPTSLISLTSFLLSFLPSFLLLSPWSRPSSSMLSTHLPVRVTLFGYLSTPIRMYLRFNYFLFYVFRFSLLDSHDTFLVHLISPAANVGWEAAIRHNSTFL